ncbi:uncharacterized protein OCT59_008977 [Rhizophagus irregularis]|uniref:Uncharacterized protein n=1 Tax=Rhizophagus irregularis (strain DAOM 181602 / DAOM 197198 / MUCL 43194) TaxID=747089 RepID=A0A2P4Q4B6_RHIID|nr:hypothetical protein GLOIN_2v1773652 [Rhizophagus irregularis DAOM 181602=DAOM 197198]POG72487.1 hypothetical protein GLOIN_2v1773652 [Rhizophagus irregularis DAOM 181602=DAOM 197198]UZO17628.1 hypothetical protein OCT59_008977 [Rhizophagus irregularis]|eukprot:XP_025179353.1 hypothetical protein GLOIN_2v1773652 [Rhizophagus irregularis DAOM 181602=DAOM 197198]
MIKRDIIGSYLFGLESRAEKYSYIDLDARMNILPLSSSQNTIQLGIRLRSPTIQFHPGSKELMQKYIIPYITCMTMTCRRSLIKNAAKKYVSTAGIPFVEKVSEMPASGNLEDRVQIIETLLKEYYLDVEFLEILKKEKNNVSQSNESITRKGFNLYIN